MDTIDITDAEFSLDKMNDNLSGFPSINTDTTTSNFDYTIYIYLVCAIIFVILFFLTHKYFAKSTSKKVTFQDKLDDCYGNVCPI